MYYRLFLFYSVIWGVSIRYFNKSYETIKNDKSCRSEVGAPSVLTENMTIKMKKDCTKQSSSGCAGSGKRYVGISWWKAQRFAEKWKWKTAKFV